MANLDSNQWYHIYSHADNTTAMMGSSLFDDHGRNGTTFFQAANITKAWQQWQFSSVGSGYYVLRTRDSGWNGFLVTAHSPDTTKTRTQTLATMVRGDLTDDSVYWKVGMWNDGTYYLTNKANGTGLHLEDTDTAATMSSNITAPQDGQRFLFDKVSAIDDIRFSTVNLQSSASTSSTASATLSSSSMSPLPSTNDNSSGSSPASDLNDSGTGLSNPAKAAIGGSIGGVAVIALVLLGLFLWRRRQRKQKMALQQKSHDVQVYAQNVWYEMPPSEIQNELVASDMKHEMPSFVRPVELPAPGGR